jgi:hypothetical protein
MEIEINNAYPILTYPGHGSLNYEVDYWKITGFVQGGFFDVEIPFKGLKGDEKKFVELVREKMLTLS